MRDRVEQRLTELRSELAAGQRMMSELEARRSELQATLLRITGAIQVLEEMLGAEPAPEHATAAPATSRPGDGAALPTR